MPRARLAQAAALIAGLAALAPAASADDFFVTIKTPTGNIGCAYSRFTPQPAVLRCDIRSGLLPQPPRPKSCDLDWAYGYEMGTTGRAHTFCAGDTVFDPRARVVAYGRSWTRGGFTCASRRTGLACLNRSGHGFVLSRAHSKTL